MDTDILKTFRYFAHFSYAVSFDDVYLFHPKRIAQKSLKNALQELTTQKKVLKKDDLYTLGGYSIYIRKRRRREAISKDKILKVKKVIHIFQKVPFIQFVGLSGSVGMRNAETMDDIDLFIITARKRLWLGRLAAILITSSLGVRRTRTMKHVGDKVCLNLFFSEEELELPYFKKTEYGAHEVLQVKPLINKNFTYERFMQANKWVLDFFPNAVFMIPTKRIRAAKFNTTFIGNMLEFVARRLQLWSINRHKTTEYITDTQLWFFPRDYEKRLKK